MPTSAREKREGETLKKKEKGATEGTKKERSRRDQTYSEAARRKERGTGTVYPHENALEVFSKGQQKGSSYRRGSGRWAASARASAEVALAAAVLPEEGR